MKHLERYRYTGKGKLIEPAKDGLLFCHPQRGKVLDLTESGFQVVGMCVDTYRQLFRGRVLQDILTDVDYSLELREKTFNFHGQDWLLGKSGKNSGYQYRLQNNHLGLIILFKMFHAKADSESTHLKIECSPWFLERHSPEYIDNYLHSIAERILVTPEIHYPAIHLALDLQGWKPEKNLCDKVICRSNRISNYQGIDELSFNLSRISCVYGQAQSFKFGHAASTQLAIYNKSLQAKETDKLDYMRSKWRRFTENDKGESSYSPKEEVFRIEVRFHHSVIKELALGSFDLGSKTGEIGVPLKRYAEITQHLQGLWEYGMMMFKLKQTRNYFHPIWTLLLQDVLFAPVGLREGEPVAYRRYHKRPDSFSGKNYQLLLGNFISCCARKELPVQVVIDQLQQLVIWDDITNYYESIGRPEGELLEKMTESYQERLLLGYAI